LRYVLFKNLEEYEDQLRAYVRHYRRNLEILRREERWDEIGASLTEQLEGLLQRFAVAPAERSAIVERWEETHNPNARKKYLSLLQSRLAHQEFSQRPGLLPTALPALEIKEAAPPDQITETVPEGEFSGTIDDESRKWFEAAAAAGTNREKRRLLRRAMGLARQAHATPIQEQPAVSADLAEKKRINTEVSFLSLQDLARERFNLAAILPARVNSVMAREIILALLAPGKTGRRFHAAYRAEDTLRVFVRRQYEVHVGRQFSPRVFRDTLSWLVNEEVLVTKPKTDEQVYSLSSKTRNKSAEAQKVITAFINFDRSLRIM
jgi:hypothetical protein